MHCRIQPFLCPNPSLRPASNFYPTSGKNFCSGSLPGPMLPTRYLAPFAQAKYLLRALGFELLNTFLRPRIEAELPKPVLRRSRWIALSRCAIHLIPCGVFSFLIYLNSNAIYLGPGFSYTRSDGLYLAFFQVAAKLLELACVASLTTVVLHVLRHDLIRDGVPFGFVGSGLFFSQANCLWAPEMFVGALYSVKSWRRLRLLLVIGVAAIIAVLIAPSSAVLLQPRLQNVPAGGTEYFLPATPDELWPSVVNGTDELPECFDEADARHILCASGGFESLRTYFKNFNSSMTVPLTMLGYINPRPIIVQSPSARIPRLLSTGSIYGFNRETTISQTNAITAIIQQSLTQDWYDLAQARSGRSISAAKEYKYAREYISSASTTNPAVGVRCAMAQNISTDVFSVNFPVKLWANRELTSSQEGSPQWDEGEVPFNISTFNPKISDELQINWVSLPTDRFGPVSGGVYLQFPWEPTTRSRAVIGCSISATWICAKVTSDSVVGDAAWLIAREDGSSPNVTMGHNASSAHACDYHRLITLKGLWYQSLTPSTSSQDCKNQSRSFNTLQRLFSDAGVATELVAQRTQPQLVFDQPTGSCVLKAPDASTTDVDRLNSRACGFGGRHQLIELILASTFANGLSRYGSRRAFNLAASPDARSDPFTWDLKKPPRAPGFSQSLLSISPKHNAVLSAPPGSGFVTQSMRCEVFGYAWYMSSISDYLAIGVVVAYMVIAIAYTVWVLFVTGVTSSSWDTVTELLALALQSPVPETLSGSGAGLERLATYKRLVRLRARREEGGERHRVRERLVLIVGNEAISGNAEGDLMREGRGGSVRHRKVEVDEEYS